VSCALSRWLPPPPGKFPERRPPAHFSSVQKENGSSTADESGAAFGHRQGSAELDSGVRTVRRERMSGNHPSEVFTLDSAVEAGQRIHKPQMDTDKHGFLTGSFFHPPGESAIFCKPFVSVFIRVHPWLC
jgi:hypothetical protein